MSKATSKRLTEAQQTERRGRRATLREARAAVVRDLRAWHVSRAIAREKAAAARRPGLNPKDPIARAWGRGEVDPAILNMTDQEWRAYAPHALDVTPSEAQRIRATAATNERTEFVKDMRGQGPNRRQRRASGQRGPRP